MMANDEAVLRGFDMPASDIGDQLHFRLPLLSFRGSPTLYVAGRVDWQTDRPALLTIVDDPEDREMATLLADGVSRHVASGQGVVVAGAEFFHAASWIGNQLNDFSRLSRSDCWFRLATPAEFVALKGELIDKSRAVFDHALGEASRQGKRLTERGNAAMLILRRCGPLRREDLAIRQLAAARQNRDFDLYRRLLARFEHELGEPEDRLDKQASRHIDLAYEQETLPFPTMPSSEKALVYAELAEDMQWHSTSMWVEKFLVLDDQSFASSFFQLSAAVPTNLWTERKGKPTSSDPWNPKIKVFSGGSGAVTMDGWEEKWNQAQSA